MFHSSTITDPSFLDCISAAGEGRQILLPSPRRTLMCAATDSRHFVCREGENVLLLLMLLFLIVRRKGSDLLKNIGFKNLLLVVEILVLIIQVLHQLLSYRGLFMMNPS